MCHGRDSTFVLLFFFFFKQKTAYEMRISDWSSDVCSSDLMFAQMLFELRFVGFNECIAQNAEDRADRAGLRLIGAAAEFDARRKLVRALVLQHVLGTTGEPLPQQLQRIVVLLLDVVLPAEESDVAEQRLGITGQLTVLGVKCPDYIATPGVGIAAPHGLQQIL